MSIPAMVGRYALLECSDYYTRRPCKSHWPYYVRIQNPEFITGSLRNGISLTDLKGALGVNAFVTTKRNAARGNGNTDPNHAYLQQGAVRLAAASRLAFGTV
jgi:hypothetical protein